MDGLTNIKVERYLVSECLQRLIILTAGAYYGHYQMTNALVARGTKLFSYILTHQGEHSYTDIMGQYYILYIICYIQHPTIIQEYQTLE